MLNDAKPLDDEAKEAPYTHQLPYRTSVTETTTHDSNREVNRQADTPVIRNQHVHRAVAAQITIPQKTAPILARNSAMDASRWETTRKETAQNYVTEAEENSNSNQRDKNSRDTTKEGKTS